MVPICDEEATLAELERRLDAVMERLDGSAEVVLVDDGSRDRSFELMSRRSAIWDSALPRRPPFANFGHQLAITAGSTSLSARQWS